MKWTGKKSIYLSTVLVWVLLAVLVVCAVAAPFAVRFFSWLISDERGTLTLIYGTTYLSLAIGFVACFKLMSLLGNIRKEQVFIEANVSNLRWLSWLCFAVSLLYLVTGCFWPPALIIFFAAAFFGLLLRIIKNVFEAAIVLREENEGTI